MGASSSAISACYSRAWGYPLNEIKNILHQHTNKTFRHTNKERTTTKTAMSNKGIIENRRRLVQCTLMGQDNTLS